MDTEQNWFINVFKKKVIGNWAASSLFQLTYMGVGWKTKREFDAFAAWLYCINEMEDVKATESFQVN